jgi:hypothetical protein
MSLNGVLQNTEKNTMKIRIDHHAGVQVVDDYRKVRFGFEITGGERKGDVRQLLSLLDGGKRTIHLRGSVSNGKAKTHVYGEVELSVIERWCWKVAPKIMSSRERDRFLDYFSTVGVTARKLSSEELRPGRGTVD